MDAETDDSKYRSVLYDIRKLQGTYVLRLERKKISLDFFLIISEKQEKQEKNKKKTKQ